MTDKKLPAIVTDLSDSSNNDQSEDPSTLIPTPSDHTKVDIDLLSPHSDPSNPFAYIPTQLASLMDPKNLQLLASLGGLEGVAKGLHADVQHGLSPAANIDSAVSMSSPEMHPFEPSNNFDKRIAVFGTNRLPEAKAKNIFQLMFLAFRDKTLILLAVAAVVSLAIGLYEDIAVPEYDSQGNKIPGVKWVEGVAIIVAITIVVLAGSINDFQKEKQFRKLNAKKEDRQIKVTRQGEVCMVSVHEILVGDVIHLEPGDIVAADGIFIQGHNLRCDESAATGESDAVRKLPWEACWRMTYGECSVEYNEKGQQQDAAAMQQSTATTKDNSFLAPPSPSHNRNSRDNLSMASTAAGSDVAGKPIHIEHAHRSVPDPFIISGSKVLEGMATYLVTCVGVNSYHGRTMMALRTQDEMTPLQTKLNGLAEMIAKLGSAAAVVMLVALLIRYFVEFRYGVPSDGAHIAADVMSILILVVTVIVVAVPEGLPLAVTLALAYATQRMLKDNNLVRVLASCETMGNATTVCSDKTGTLTENKMTVVAGTFGHDVKAQRGEQEDDAEKPEIVSITALAKCMPKPVLSLIHEAVAINSSAFEGKDDNGNKAIVGNKTETAMLNFCMETGSEHFETLRESYPVEHLFPFSSERKAMATIIRVSEQQPLYRFHLKGASEILVDLCSHVVSCADSNNDSIMTLPLTDTERAKIQNTIHSYAARGLRTIAVAYQDTNQWPPAAAPIDAEEVTYEDLVKNKDLTLLAILGIEDPLRPGVKDAVKACQNAGVVVRMVTGDNVLTAKSIAEQCGIYSEGGIVMEGPKFRNLPHSEMDAIIPKLQVLARSSPEDKRILVDRLKKMGETVAVTGDGTNDGPALKLADVGFSMGIAGTEVAKEASSIILMDDNFASIVKAISWGRCVNDAVRKFLEFQLTVNVTAVILTFISGVASEKQKSVLTAVQLLWVNLIMDTLAALALATDPPTEELLQRGPEPKSAPLISIRMWKMIIGQSIFQIVVTFVLLYGRILDYDPEDVVLQTIVFNTFVFCQIFNEINCRRIDKKYNVFSNIWANKFFICIFFGCVGLQAIIVNFGGVAFQVTRVDGPSWALAIVVGMFSLPVGALVRTIPDSVVLVCAKVVGKPFKILGKLLSKLCFWRKRSESDD